MSAGRRNDDEAGRDDEALARRALFLRMNTSPRDCERLTADAELFLREVRFIQLSIRLTRGHGSGLWKVRVAPLDNYAVFPGETLAYVDPSLEGDFISLEVAEHIAREGTVPLRPRKCKPVYIEQEGREVRPIGTIDFGLQPAREYFGPMVHLYDVFVVENLSHDVHAYVGAPLANTKNIKTEVIKQELDID